MTTLMRLFFLAILAMLTTACAIRTGRGTFYVGGVTDQVIVTNNTRVPCDLYRNGERLNPISPGGTGRVGFGLATPNMHLACKAFDYRNGERYSLGIAEAYFTPNAYSGYQQSWTISWYNPPGNPQSW